MHERGVSVGLYLQSLSPDIVELCGHLGFEWLFLDAEHLPVSHGLCRDLVRAADVVGMPCLVRVPQIEPAVIEGFLDAGVRGILAPRVCSARDAQALVAAVKFHPEGERRSASNSRAANYGLTQSRSEYYRAANERTFTAALIETRGGLDRLDEIASVPGLDYIAIGPNDLGLSMGITEGLADPRVQELVTGAQARLRSSGTPQLAVATDVKQAQAAVAAGATLIAVPDSALLAAAGKAFLHAVSAAT
jgi:4-hydroxy-2-oxoheptanedioate aldolase